MEKFITELIDTLKSEAKENLASPDYYQAIQDVITFYNSTVNKKRFVDTVKIKFFIDKSENPFYETALSGKVFQRYHQNQHEDLNKEVINNMVKRAADKVYGTMGYDYETEI